MTMIPIERIEQLLIESTERNEKRINQLEIKLNDIKDRLNEIPHLSGLVRDLFTKISPDNAELLPAQTATKKTTKSRKTAEPVPINSTIDDLCYVGTNMKANYNIYVGLVKNNHSNFAQVLTRELCDITGNNQMDINQVDYKSFYETYLSSKAPEYINSDAMNYLRNCIRNEASRN